MTVPAALKPLSKTDVGDVLGVSQRTVENWVNDGTLPAPTKLGSRCYWHPVAFYAWLDRRLLGESATSVAVEVRGVAKVSDPAAVLAPNAAPRERPTKSVVKRASSADRMRAKDQAALQALMA